MHSDRGQGEILSGEGKMKTLEKVEASGGSQF